MRTSEATGSDRFSLSGNQSQGSAPLVVPIRYRGPRRGGRGPKDPTTGTGRSTGGSGAGCERAAALVLSHLQRRLIPGTGLTGSGLREPVEEG